MIQYVPTRKNIIHIVAAICLLVVGYVMLGQGPEDSLLSRSLAPLVLVLTYCGYLPWAIITSDRKGGGRKDEVTKG